MDSALRQSCLQAALVGIQDGRAEAAERICRDLVRQDPSDIHPLLLLGLALGISGKPQQAAPVLNHVAALRSEVAHPCTDLAHLMAAQGKTRLVAPQYQACLALTPLDRRLRFGLADSLRDRGDGAAALAVLHPLLSHTDAEVHYQVGLALAEAGRFAEAANRFQMAIADDPAPAAFWANLG